MWNLIKNTYVICLLYNGYIYLFNKSTIHCIFFWDIFFHLYHPLTYFHCLQYKIDKTKQWLPLNNIRKLRRICYVWIWGIYRSMKSLFVTEVLVVSFFCYTLLPLFWLATRLDSQIQYILRKFPRGFQNWAKTSLASKYNFIATITIFCEIAVINLVHIFDT